MEREAIGERTRDPSATSAAVANALETSPLARRPTVITSIRTRARLGRYGHRAGFED